MEKKLKIHIIKIDEEPFKNIFLSAKNCFNNESYLKLKAKYNYLDGIKLAKSLLLREHMSIFEHTIYQFYLENVSRSFLAQLSRHRIGMSLTVKSQHYINHENFNYKELETDNKEAQIYYNKLMSFINVGFKRLIKDYKIPHYIAREVLPNSCLCNIFVTINLRELIHIFDLRLGKENTPEIRYVFKRLYLNLERYHTELFELLEDKYKFKKRFI